MTAFPPYIAVHGELTGSCDRGMPDGTYWNTCWPMYMILFLLAIETLSTMSQATPRLVAIPDMSLITVFCRSSGPIWCTEMLFRVCAATTVWMQKCSHALLKSGLYSGRCFLSTCTSTLISISVSKLTRPQLGHMQTACHSI